MTMVSKVEMLRIAKQRTTLKKSTGRILMVLRTV
jgi:hypothetical protein